MTHDMLPLADRIQDDHGGKDGIVSQALRNAATMTDARPTELLALGVGNEYF